LKGPSSGAIAPRIRKSFAGVALKNVALSAGLAPVVVALLREAGPLAEGADAIARRIKRCEPRLAAPAPIARATAGGVIWSEIDADFMLIKRPGIFVAGEMIGWEAPTGGLSVAGLVRHRRRGRARGGAMDWLRGRREYPAHPAHEAFGRSP
jgi:HI0933-like protein